MSDNIPAKQRGAVRFLPATGIALASPFLAWFAIGDLSINRLRTLSHEFGPYDVDPVAAYVVGGMAAVLALVSLVALIILTRQGLADSRSWAVVATLAVAGAIGAYGWRSLTAGYTGAPLGIALVWLLDPLLIAGLLVGAVWTAGGGGLWKVRRMWLLTMAAVFVAPTLYVLLFVLSSS